MSKKKQKTKDNDRYILYIFIFFIAFIAFKQLNNYTSKNKIKNENIYNFEMLQQICDNIDIRNEQAENAVSIIKKIGINTIINIKPTEFLFQKYSSTNGYYIEQEADIVYECIGNDNTQYECNFLIFIKNNEIIHICYYGYGSKTVYYDKSKGILHKTVHPYTSN